MMETGSIIQTATLLTQMDAQTARLVLDGLVGIPHHIHHLIAKKYVEMAMISSIMGVMMEI